MTDPVGMNLEYLPSFQLTALLNIGQQQHFVCFHHVSEDQKGNISIFISEQVKHFILSNCHYTCFFCVSVWRCQRNTHLYIAFVCDSIMAESYSIGRKAIRQTKMLLFSVRSLPPLTLLSSYNEVG